MNSKDIQKELDTCISFLIKIGFSYQQTWNYSKQGEKGIVYIIPKGNNLGMLKFRDINDYMEQHTKLTKERKFTLLTFDNTIIYIDFIFDNEKIIKNRYIVLPDLTIYSGENMPNEYLDEEKSIYLDMTNSFQLNFPFRIDFDNNEMEEKSPVIPGEHSATHIHLGFIDGCRIPISRPLTPKLFFKFLIENFYNEFYKENKNEIDKFFEVSNGHLFDEKIDEVDKLKLYFDIHIPRN